MKWKLRVALATIVMLCGIAGPLAAGPLDNAVAAYKRGDFVSAFQLFRLLAEQGNATAQYSLGLMYSKGELTTSTAYDPDRPLVPSHQDYIEAVKWFRLAAEQGHAHSQSALGRMHYTGHGVTKSHREALHWFRKSAKQGDGQAQYHLGFIYKNGHGVLQDYAGALKWLQLAAEQGVGDAQYILGVMYHNVRGVPQDLIQAHMWYNLSAANDSKPPWSRHRDWGPDEAAEARDLVASMMTPAQIAEAQRLAREWKPEGQPE